MKEKRNIQRQQWRSLVFTAHNFNAPNTFDVYFRTIVLDDMKNILAGSNAQEYFIRRKEFKDGYLGFFNQLRVVHVCSLFFAAMMLWHNQHSIIDYNVEKL